MKKMILILPAVLISLCGNGVIFAADPAGDSNSNYTVEQRKRFSNVIEQGQAFTANLSLAEIENQFGQPLRIHSTVHENRYDSQNRDYITVLFYQHYVFRLYRVEQSKNEFVTHFSLLTNQREALWGIKPGISEKELRMILGEPVFVENGMLTWEDSATDAPAALICHIKNGFVSRIDFSFYYE